MCACVRVCVSVCEHVCVWYSDYKGKAAKRQSFLSIRKKIGINESLATERTHGYCSVSLRCVCVCVCVCTCASVPVMCVMKFVGVHGVCADSC